MGGVRGEYWIQDGRADFADGDVGDQNHEMIALNSVAADHVEELMDYAQELGVDTEDLGIYDEPFTTVSELLKAIHYALVERGVASVKASEFVIKRLGVDLEVYKMLGGGGDARLYVMKKYGWIAVRSNNIELFGYDHEKRRELASGLEEILDQEGIETPDEELEFSLYDHRTGRSSDVTLADIKGESPMRPQTMPNTTYNKPLFVPADRSKISSRPMDARTRSMLQTSESFVGFSEWLVRREWPTLARDEERPKNPTCRKVPPKNRR